MQVMAVLVHFSVMVIMTGVVLFVVYLYRRFTTRSRMNIQAIVLDCFCFYAVLHLSSAIDDALNWRGDFVDLVIIGFYAVMLSSPFDKWTLKSK